jgi:hypothetical protein
MTFTDRPFEGNFWPIERPRCPRCQKRMMLARRAPCPGDVEKRTFECPVCDFIVAKFVDYPLKPRPE